jgi:hypothetical protein
MQLLDRGAREFASFRDFYPFYLGEHANRISRRLHVIGTCAALAQWVAAALLGLPLLLVSGLLTGYALAWIGHFVFEKNRPATFRHPLYSLLGDFVMARDVLARRIDW